MKFFSKLFLFFLLCMGLVACSIDVPSVGDLDDYEDYDRDELFEGTDRSMASNSLVTSRTDLGNGNIAFATSYGVVTVIPSGQVHLGDDYARLNVVQDNNSPILDLLKASGTLENSDVISLVAFDEDDSSDDDYYENEEIMAFVYNTGPNTLSALQSQFPSLVAQG